jgi:folate-binding protein YgfZ
VAGVRRGLPKQALPFLALTPYLSRMTDRIARLDSRALIRVAGPEAKDFLHNLLTQNVETLGEGELRFGALLSPPGRLMFDLFLWGEGEAVILDVAAEKRDALFQRLSMYRLRAKVEVEADDRPIFASWPGVAEGFVADPRTPGLGGRALGVREANATEADWDAHRLSVGAPDPVRDTDEGTYPIEANFDLLNGIDFAKGCFVGQETTSRMKRRGEIKKRMLPIAFEGSPPAVGGEILNGELRAGEVLSGMEGGAMALVRLDRIDGALTVDGRPVTVRRPEWMTG